MAMDFFIGVHVSTLTDDSKPTNHVSRLNDEMTLKERLEEVMRTLGWTRKDLVKHSGQSSSVVSQWLGNGSKEIKSIGKVDTAVRLQEASGFAAAWIAMGVGPKHVQSAQNAHEPPGAYLTPRQTLAHFADLLRTLAPELRPAFADILASWARDGAAEDRASALLALLEASDKHRAAA